MLHGVHKISIYLSNSVILTESYTKFNNFLQNHYSQVSPTYMFTGIVFCVMQQCNDQLLFFLIPKFPEFFLLMRHDKVMLPQHGHGAHKVRQPKIFQGFNNITKSIRNIQYILSSIAILTESCTGLVLSNIQYIRDCLQVLYAEQCNNGLIFFQLSKFRNF